MLTAMETAEAIKTGKKSRKDIWNVNTEKRISRRKNLETKYEQKERWTSSVPAERHGQKSHKRQTALRRSFRTLSRHPYIVCSVHMPCTHRLLEAIATSF